MKYYSTNGKADRATLHEAVVKGLAGDKGLFMPETIKRLPDSFFEEIQDLSFQEVACRVADAFFGEDVPADTLRQIVYDTLSFDCPVVKVTDTIYSLELFHGPTLAFKDVGARFMARLLGYFIKQEGSQKVNVLVATSGDTGSAVANGFLGVEGIHVYVLYPKGKVMGLPVKRFIAANNANDIFYNYLQTGEYHPRASVQTIANAMDVGDPSNFARIYDLYKGSHAAIAAEISGATYTDAQIAETVKACYEQNGYLLDPHGACGFRALTEGLREGETGVFLETAHPAKFKSTVEGIIGQPVAVPDKLAAFMKGEKKSVPMSKRFEDFKAFLMKE